VTKPDNLPAPGQGGAVVRREARTYEPWKPQSWFIDMITSQRGDFEAAARLARHAEEFAVEVRANPALLGPLEQRTNPGTTLGQGGEFAPPLWVIPLFSPAAAGGRIVADLIDRVGNLYPLAPGVSSVHVPRMVVGALDAPQAQAAAVASQDPTTADAAGQGQVVTMAGEVDVDLKLLEQTPAPGLDRIIAMELGSNYNQNLDQQCLFGKGTGRELLGLASVSGANTVSGSGANTIALFWPLLGQVGAAVGNTRLQPIKHWVMAVRRWEWIASSVDSSNRPISSPGADSPRVPAYDEIGGDYVSSVVPFGPINGRPVWTSGAILSQGVHPNTAADTVFGIRPRDLLLWESTPRLAVDQQVLSGTLQVRVQLRRYVAAIFNRYPAGIGLLTNVPAPTNF